MRKLKILLVTIIFFSGSQTHLSAQDTVKWKGINNLLDNVTHVFKSNHPGLTFFKYHLISPDGNVYDWYGNNNSSDSIISLPYYLNAVKDLQLSNFDTISNPVAIARLQRAMIPRLQQGYTPLSFSFVEYEDLKDSTIGLGRIGWDNNQFTETVVAGFYPFKKKRLFIASALNHIIKTPEIKFIIDDSLILSNIPGLVDSIYVNFDNGTGFTPLRKGQTYSISYGNEGLKNCVMKIKASSNYYYSSFQIYDSTATWGNKIGSPCSTDPDSLINISVSNGGNTVHGRYGIYFSNCNTTKKMRKPYIIAVGYNPGEGMQLRKLDFVNNDITVNVNGGSVVMPVTIGWRGTYYELYNGGWNHQISKDESTTNGEGCDNGNKYLDRLREEGYDIVILMNTDGRDLIQNNAALLTKLIIRLNEHKMDNGFYFENVVSGYSAEDLASRLSLAQMEEKYRLGTGPHHHSKLWVNFEGENQGANVPLGFQYLVDFHANPAHTLPTFFGYLNILQIIADVANIQAAGIAQTFINGPAAKQINLFAPQNPSGPSAERSALLNDFTNISGNSSEYPDYLRRVAVSQGSSKGSQVPHTTASAFKTQLKFNPMGNSFTESDCDGSYTVYRPVSTKVTEARWWSSNNSQNIFDGDVYINANWTYMKRICNTWFGGCNCIGPFIWAGQVNNVASQHIAKPTSPSNYDDVPASNQAVHKELFTGSAFRFYNNWFAGNSSASADPMLNGLAPTVSVLDLKTLPNGNFTSPDGLGLMNIKPLTEPLPQHPNLRFGFPHLVSLNHYSITPFDGIFAIGSNNGFDVNNNPRPDNQYHVEDPQNMIGSYLSRVEVAPETLFLTNNTVGSTAINSPNYLSGYVAEFEARDSIIAGKFASNGYDNIYSIHSNPYYLTPNDYFRVAIGSSAILHCGTEIEFLPGFEIPQNAELMAFIQPYRSSCPNNLNRVTHNSTDESSQNSLESLTEKITPKESEHKRSIKIYPNPTNGQLTIINPSDKQLSELLIYHLSGQVVYKDMFNNRTGKLDISNFENGIYLLLIDSQRFKLIINK